MHRGIILLLAFLLIVSPSLAQQDNPPTPEKIEIRVWWPDDLAMKGDQSLLRQLETQVERFNSTNEEYAIELRLKPHRGLGSILTTMTAAQPVAVAAQPDLILLRRDDLVKAAESGLIFSLDEWVPDTLRGDLLLNTISLGQIGETLYGLPYAINLEHTVYRVGTFRVPPSSFSSVLNNEFPFVMPGLPSEETVVNSVVLGQYLQAGGRLVDSAEQAILDEEPLQQVLSYYASGLEVELFSPDLLAYASPTDYWTSFTQGDFPIVVMDSRTYLQNPKPTFAVRFEALPSVDGVPLVLLDGWSWALASSDAEHQRGALAFVTHMMSTEIQADYTQALGVVPSRQRALRLWEQQDYAEEVRQWIESALIIPVEQRNNLAAAQLQSAFSAVLAGVPFEEAADQAVTALEEAPSR
jgi:maltose-binding protein MalE